MQKVNDNLCFRTDLGLLMLDFTDEKLSKAPSIAAYRPIYIKHQNGEKIKVL